MSKQQVKLTSTNQFNSFIYVFLLWLSSRLAIVLAMQLISPLLPNEPINYDTPLLGFEPNFIPQRGWELFTHWDGKWYGQIATVGYDYATDGQQHSIAFFPLFPLLIRLGMSLGLSLEVSGTLVNNLAFFGALLILYWWAEERHGTMTAKWSTAVMAWFPYSIYGTVVYTEGLFLLLTTAALWAFERHKYAQASLWGALATATRAPAVALMPAFLLVAWREKRPFPAYLASIATLSGLVAFSFYCLIRFGDFTAYHTVQTAWNPPDGVTTVSGWSLGAIAKTLNLSPIVLILDTIITVISILGGGWLLWYFRSQLSKVTVAYGFCSLAIVLKFGGLNSMIRFTFAIVSLSLALGLLLARHPRWGFLTLSIFAAILMHVAIRFAWWQWVA